MTTSLTIPWKDENWAPVDGWPYEVSDHGRVRRSEGSVGTWRGRILSSPPNGSGYPVVVLSGRSRRRMFYVHRLVATAFLGPVPVGQNVNHLDGDKSNNHVDNLEYLTPGDNNRHAHSVGLMAKGERHGHSRLTRRDVVRIRAMADAGCKAREVARRIGAHESTVRDVMAGRTWGHVE